MSALSSHLLFRLISLPFPSYRPHSSLINIKTACSTRTFKRTRAGKQHFLMFMPNLLQVSLWKQWQKPEVKAWKKVSLKWVRSVNPVCSSPWKAEIKSGEQDVVTVCLCCCLPFCFHTKMLIYFQASRSGTTCLCLPAYGWINAMIMWILVLKPQSLNSIKDSNSQDALRQHLLITSPCHF